MASSVASRHRGALPHVQRWHVVKRMRLARQVDNGACAFTTQGMIPVWSYNATLPPLAATLRLYLLSTPCYVLRLSGGRTSNGTSSRCRSVLRTR